MDFAKLRSLASPDMARELDAIEEMAAGSPLLICIAGAFSTGKTSLLNRLLEKPFLPVALEESTALPAFLEYGPQESCHIVYNDRMETIDRDALEAAILTPPPGARFVDITLPVAWLAGMRLADLPGTGGVDEVKKEYARQQMRAADAVVYLLHPRGPTMADLENLKLLHTLGKKILVCAAQWDLVEDGVRQGEKAPDLSQWRQDIAWNTGLECGIVPLDKFGLGMGEVLEFFMDSAADLARLRDARMEAELLPWLNACLEEKYRLLKILEAKTDQEKSSCHQKLLDARESLMGLREKTSRDRQTDMASILNQWDEGIKTCAEKLDAELADLENSHQNPEQWERFLQEGQEYLHNSLAGAARLGRNLSEAYGGMELDLPAREAEGIILPPPPTLNVEDFLDAGRFGALHDELLELKERQEKCAASHANDLPASREDRDDLVLRIKELESRRQNILSQPLPMQELEQPTGQGSGSTVGRMLGEMADMALIFWWPATWGSKAASLAGKTAKTLGMGTKAVKMARKVAKQTVNAARTAHQAAAGGDVAPPPILEKLEILDKFTLGYWGEKIGSYFDAPAEADYVVDEAALARRDSQLASLETELRKLRLAMLNARRPQHGDSSLAARLQAEIESKQKRLQTMRQEAEAARDAALEKASEEYRRKFMFARQRAVASWRRTFERQSGHMRELLQALIRDWWESRIPALLAGNQKNVDDLLARMRDLPAGSGEEESVLRDHIGQLELMRDQLRGGSAKDS